MDITLEVGHSSDKEFKLFLWGPETFPSVWPETELLLLRDKRWEEYFTLESFYAMGTSGRVSVWTMHDAGGMVGVLFAEPEVWPQKTVMRLVWGSAIPPNGLRAVRRFLPFIELWAKRCGMAEVEIIGRLGWERLLPDYKLRSILLTKDLSDLKEH